MATWQFCSTTGFCAASAPLRSDGHIAPTLITVSSIHTASVPQHIPVIITARVHSHCVKRVISTSNLATVPLQANTPSNRKQKSVSDKTPILKMALINARSVSNKTFLLRDFFSSHNLDFLFLTETWLKSNDNVVMNAMCPTNCKFISDPRPSGKGGGLAAVFKQQFSCSSVALGIFNTFEVHMFRIGKSNPFYSILIYRVPGPNNGFLTEFAEFLSSLVVNYSPLLITGDFNIHVDVEANKFAADFIHLTESFNLRQHVTGPTHTHGHTLDLVFTLGLSLSALFIDELFVSDHKAI